MPRPHRISPRARAYVRAQATQVMQHTVRIERVSKAQFNESDLTATPGGKVLVYEGVCRLWEVTGQGIVQIADDNVVLQSTNLSIPWDEPKTGLVPQRDDEFEILSSHVDPTVVGLRGVLMDVAKAGDLRATRRFSVQLHQPKGQHG